MLHRDHIRGCFDQLLDVRAPSFKAGNSLKTSSSELQYGMTFSFNCFIVGEENMVFERNKSVSYRFIRAPFKMKVILALVSIGLGSNLISPSFAAEKGHEVKEFLIDEARNEISTKINSLQEDFTEILKFPPYTQMDLAKIEELKETFSQEV